MWAVAEPSRADGDEDRVRQVLADRSRVGDMVRGDPVERLERDGSMIWLRAPLAADTTSSWYRLQQDFDPIFLFSDE